MVKQSIFDVVEHCLTPETGCYTPSDFPLTLITQQQLNNWQENYQIIDIYPATSMQQGLLFHSKLDSSAYVTQLMFTLDFDVNIDVFQKAWQKTVDRHAILRTIFATTDEGYTQQIVLKNMQLQWFHDDLSDCNEDKQKNLIEEYQINDKSLGFELTQGPLLRFGVWSLGDKGHRILFTNHHAIIDGWSLPFKMLW